MNLKRITAAILCCLLISLALLTSAYAVPATQDYPTVIFILSL